ncbi:protein lin-54 homolog [Leptidea sinapis]|uniref:protein lin-54 homolog n=1 Tax=Leptidea sinapis TaxID=189913 RepID=UPI0021C4AF47|nr:protein lin-54 homolog [Leptidea sinapis]
MDHHLDDSLNFDSTMAVDFEQPIEQVCSPPDLNLVGVQEIPMEFEDGENKPIILETESEEIIISDYMDGQFDLQDFQTEQSSSSNVGHNEQILNVSSQSETMLDLQLKPQIVIAPQQLHNLKPVVIQKLPIKPLKKVENTAPRQVAIAPKPPKLAKLFTQGPPVSLAPKLVPVIASKNVINKASIASLLQGNSSGKTVLAQIGKQIMMVPASTQKLKVVSSQNNVQQYIRASQEQAQNLLTGNMMSAIKPKTVKVVSLQGQTNDVANAPTKLTKILPANHKLQQARFVTVQQKSLNPVPLSIGDKILMPPKNIKIAKKQEIIPVKPAAPGTLLPLAPKAVPTKKVVISTSSSSNVILAPTTSAKPNPTQVTKDMVSDVQQSQLHQINVPGKGVRYVRLITNPAGGKASIKPQKIFTVPLSDSKTVLGQPQQKLVRLTPVGNTSTAITPTASRPSQSLLVPLSSLAESKSIEIEVQEETPNTECGKKEQGHDCKDALRALIETTMGDDAGVNHEVDVEYRKQTVQSPVKMEPEKDTEMVVNDDEQHPLIVIPAAFEHIVEVQSENDQNISSESLSHSNDMLRQDDTYDSMRYDSINNDLSASEQDMNPSEMVLRMRKPCNCTKSQCLKLYCDCFANGEFCNRCNCINCHNNLQNEELRQKAIRGCLDRNPLAFKPKIGKAKGPETIRRHTKGCNCKRSGCLKNYCECFEARIACTAMCKCVGCRNVSDCMERARPRVEPVRDAPPQRGAAPTKDPCSFMTTEVIEAVCHCLVAAGMESEKLNAETGEADPMRVVIEEFAHCLQDIISVSQYARQDESPA